MGTTGGAFAVFGIAHRPDGAGGLFQNIAGGNVLLGSIGGNNLFQVDGMAPSMWMAVFSQPNLF